MTYQLRTSDTEVNALQHAANEARSDSKVIKVDLAALRNLLLDHHEMAGLVLKEGEG